MESICKKSPDHETTNSHKKYPAFYTLAHHPGTLAGNVYLSLAVIRTETVAVLTVSLYWGLSENYSALNSQ